jgi:hypothetical protein
MINLNKFQLQHLFHGVYDSIELTNNNSIIRPYLNKLIEKDPYKEERIIVKIDDSIIGLWLYNEINIIIDMFENDIEMSITKKELYSLIDLSNKLEKYYNDFIRRFKILTFLSLELGIWEKQLNELGEQFDINNPDVLEALTFFENNLIEVLEVKKTN